LDRLLAALKDPSEEVQRYARSALEEQGTKAKPVIPGVLQALHDPKISDRLYLIYTLARIGPEDEQARKAIRQAAEQKNNKLLRCIAIDALGIVGPQYRPGMEIIDQALKDPDEEIRAAAESALRREIERNKK
jgi:HEAT repeat protein